MINSHRGKMDLKIYLYEKKTTQKSFAKHIGISPQLMSHIITWKREPSYYVAKRIVEETKGEVTLDDLYGYWEALRK